MSTQTAPTISLQVQRVIKAPIARVFAAWTTPEQIRQWLGGECGQVAAATIDARPGGEYSFDAVSPNGPKVMRGTYREVNPPKRLVFTWIAGAGCGSGEGAHETLVTVDLKEVAGGTELRITHERFANEEVRDQHNKGWTSSMDYLEKVMAGVKTR
jgi:uncharacterized protein YndB with AHSA1/START domain